MKIDYKLNPGDLCKVTEQLEAILFHDLESDDYNPKFILPGEVITLLSYKEENFSLTNTGRTLYIVNFIYNDNVWYMDYMGFTPKLERIDLNGE